MSKKMLSVRKTEEILRFKFEANLSGQKFAASCGIAHLMQGTK